MVALSLQRGTKQLQYGEDSSIVFDITRLDCEAGRFIWEMTGENIFRAVLLEVLNEFNNLLEELSYEKANQTIAT